MNPEIILGPPGTGKTTHLLNLVDEELERGVPADRIGYLTFTRRGAEEAISRAVKKFNLDRKAFPYFRTLHSLCYRALGIQSSDVMSLDKLKVFGDWVGVKISGRFNEDGTFTGFEIGDRIMFHENLSRARMIPLRMQYDMDDDGLPWDMVDRVCRAYRAYKETHGLIDYTDMLHLFLDSGVNLRLEVLFNDEAQDQSRLQWAVIRKLAEGARRVAIAGDDDQALFKWAGADIDTLINLPGSVTVLGQSWRVPQAVQDTANEIIGGVVHRRQKDWSPRSASGEVNGYNDFGDIDCGSGQILILARNTYILREQIEPALRASGIIYEINGHSSVSKSILNAIISWERLRAGETVAVEDARGIYDYMSSGTGVARGFKKLNAFDDRGNVSMHDLKVGGGLLRDDIWHEALDRIPQEDAGYILAARKRGEKLMAEPRVRVSTIHSAKGGEADHVILMKEMANRTHREMEFDEDSERRVWYVGVTRAREKLSIVESSTQRACPWL